MKLEHDHRRFTPLPGDPVPVGPPRWFVFLIGSVMLGAGLVSLFFLLL